MNDESQLKNAVLDDIFNHGGVKFSKAVDLCMRPGKEAKSKFISSVVDLLEHVKWGATEIEPHVRPSDLDRDWFIEQCDYLLCKTFDALKKHRKESGRSYSRKITRNDF
jgi:hypothetical protein